MYGSFLSMKSSCKLTIIIIKNLILINDKKLNNEQISHMTLLYINYVTYKTHYVCNIFTKQYFVVFFGRNDKLLH